MSRSHDYSKKILKILAENKAVSVPDLESAFAKPPLRHSPEAKANATSPYKGEDFSRKKKVLFPGHFSCACSKRIIVLTTVKIFELS